MILIFTGNGQGKTSAALGIALRSLGWEKKVLVIQFIKGNKDIGEWEFARNYELGIKNQGKFKISQFFDDEKYSITEKEITDIRSKEYKESCKKVWDFTKEVIEKKNYDLIILDEIINAMHYNLINRKEVVEFLKKHSKPKLDIVLTGRNAGKKLIEIADVATEMKEVKHGFKKGLKAKKGINY